MSDVTRAEVQGRPPITYRDLGSGIYAPVYAHRRPVVIAANPTMDISIYASGDSMWTTIAQFAGAAPAVGGSGVIDKLIVVDDDAQGIDFEIWLFHTTVTIAAANAAVTITDAHAQNLVGVIRTATDGVWYADAANKVCQVKDIKLPYKCAAADTVLYAMGVTRGTPTYTAAGLHLFLTVNQD